MFASGDDDDEKFHSWRASLKRLIKWKENRVILVLVLVALIVGSVALHRQRVDHNTAQHARSLRRYCLHMRVTRIDSPTGAVDTAFGEGSLTIDAQWQIVQWEIFLSGVSNVTGLGIFGPMPLSASGGSIELAYSLAPLALELNLGNVGGAQSDEHLRGAMMFRKPISYKGDDDGSGNGNGDDDGAVVDVLVEMLRSPSVYFVSVTTQQHPRVGTLNGMLGSEC